MSSYKKIISLILAAISSLSLCACSNRPFNVLNTVNSVPVIVNLSSSSEDERGAKIKSYGEIFDANTSDAIFKSCDSLGIEIAYYVDGKEYDTYSYYEKDMRATCYSDGTWYNATPDYSYYCTSSNDAYLAYDPDRLLNDTVSFDLLFLGEDDGREKVVSVETDSGVITVETLIERAKDEDCGYRYIYYLEESSLFLLKCTAYNVYDDKSEELFLDTGIFTYNASRPTAVKNCLKLESTNSDLKDSISVSFHLEDNVKTYHIGQNDSIIFYHSTNNYNYYLDSSFTTLYTEGYVNSENADIYVRPTLAASGSSFENA